MKAHEDNIESVVWVYMKLEHFQNDSKKFEDALNIRLPGRNIKTQNIVNPIETFKCHSSREKDIAVILFDGADRQIFVEVILCENHKILMKDEVLDQKSIEEIVRRAAALASASIMSFEKTSSSLSLSSNDEPTEMPKISTENLRYPRGILDLAPGFSVTFSGKVSFVGKIELGIIFKNKLGISIGSNFFSSVSGSILNKNNSQVTETQLKTTDIAISSTLLYQFIVRQQWFIKTGIGLKYVHGIVRDVFNGKHAIEEINPASRGSGFISFTIGYDITSSISLMLTASPSLSFGKRVYKVRGDEGLNLGIGSAAIFVGLVFYL